MRILVCQPDFYFARSEEIKNQNTKLANDVFDFAKKIGHKPFLVSNEICGESPTYDSDIFKGKFRRMCWKVDAAVFIYKNHWTAMSAIGFASRYKNLRVYSFSDYKHIFGCHINDIHEPNHWR